MPLQGTIIPKYLQTHYCRIIFPKHICREGEEDEGVPGRLTQTVGMYFLRMEIHTQVIDSQRSSLNRYSSVRPLCALGHLSDGRIRENGGCKDVRLLQCSSK